MIHEGPLNKMVPLMEDRGGSSRTNVSTTFFLNRFTLNMLYFNSSYLHGKYIVVLKILAGDYVG